MKAFFLDRDGVINKTHVKNGKPLAPATLEEFEILPGVLEALNLTHKHGYLNIVVTNQPDVKTGRIKQKTLDAMHETMVKKLPIDDVFVCYDRDSFCYKPNPGMLLEASQKHGVDLSKSYMVGDRWRDMGAGRAAGCKTVFIDYKYEEKLDQIPDYTGNSLLEVVQKVLR